LQKKLYYHYIFLIGGCEMFFQIMWEHL